MDFFCAQSMWTYNEAAIELAAAGFFKRLQQHGHEFLDETELLANENLQNSARFLLVFILIHGNDKHDPFRLSRLFSTDLERH